MKIIKATKKDFLELKKLDYENSYDKMFSLELKNNSITLKEIDIEKPIMNTNDCYIGEMDDFIRDLDNKNTFAFIAFCEDKPAGYIFSRKEKRKTGDVICVDGILVANQYRKKGIARELVNHLIREVRQENCKGISVEMDTEKYVAIKLLLLMGFQFSGTELFVFSNEKPSNGSKEVVYLYYKV